MKNNLTFLFVVFFAFSLNAQIKDTIVTKGDAQNPVAFQAREQTPQFPGGERALMSYIVQNLKCPESANDAAIEGRVVLQFVVEKDGSIGGIKIKQSLHPDFDAEAIRIIREMPRWIPGSSNGKPVRVYYTLPIQFKC